MYSQHHMGTNFSLFVLELVPCSKYQLRTHSLLFSVLELRLCICCVWDCILHSVESTSRKKQVPVLHFPPKNKPKIHTGVAHFYRSVGGCGSWVDGDFLVPLVELNILFFVILFTAMFGLTMSPAPLSSDWLSALLENSDSWAHITLVHGGIMVDRKMRIWEFLM